MSNGTGTGHGNGAGDGRHSGPGAAAGTDGDTGAGTGIGTRIARHDLHHIWVRDYDLTGELMGSVSFTEMIFLLICGRLPGAEDRRLLDAILTSLVEHGLTPSAVASRLTYAMAPEAIQGAVAAGLLGAGSVLLGAMEECGMLLTRIASGADGDADAATMAGEIVAEYQASRRRIPGVGHSIHTEGDPRAIRLFEIGAECGRRGRHVEAMFTLAAAAEQAVGRPLPVNATGAIAALLLELGVPWRLHRGFALISRTAGLIAHIDEETRAPITPAVRMLLREQGPA
jgi:citrate synthase